MITCRCIDKYRDNNGKIIGYKIQDLQGTTREIKPDQLKRAIKLHKINVENLQLTKDGRLVDIKSESLSDVFTTNRKINQTQSIHSIRRKHLDTEENSIPKYNFNVYFSNLTVKFAEETQGIPGLIQYHHSGLGLSSEMTEYKCLISGLRNPKDLTGSKDWGAEISFIHMSNLKEIKITLIKIDKNTGEVTESQTKVVRKPLVDPVCSEKNLEITKEALAEFKKLIQ